MDLTPLPRGLRVADQLHRGLSGAKFLTPFVRDTGGVWNVRWLARSGEADEGDTTLVVGSTCASFEAWRFDEFDAGGRQLLLGEVR